MLNKLARHPKTTAFFLGWLTVAALPPFYVFPLLFITFSGLLLLINQAPRPRSAWGIGYAFGFAFFAFGLSWIGNALLIDAQTFGWLYPLVWLASGTFFGLFVACPCLLTWYFRKLPSRWLALSALWVIFEWLRSWFLTGFPWNLIGTVLAFNDNLIQFASFGGTWALSWWVILACSAPALYIHFRSRKTLFFAVLFPLFSFLFLGLYGVLRLSAADHAPSEIIVRLVQPAIPQTMKWDPDSLQTNFKRYIELSSLPGLEKVNFTLWGETASPYPLDLDFAHNLEARQAVPPQGYLITGQIRYALDSHGAIKPRNSLLVLAPDGSTPAWYDKSHLVPFGEYIPLRRYLPEWIKPVANAIGTFEHGNGPSEIRLSGYPPFGSLICYEVIFPHQVTNPRSRPEWIINLTNDGWYGDSAGPRQHLVSTRLRAVEEGITIARSANTGISALISPYGTIIGQLSLNYSGILDLKLPKTRQVFTTFSKYGNIIALFWCFLNLILAFFLTTRKL